MSQKIYLLDSDTLIRSSRDCYSNSFCPGFWDYLAGGLSGKIIISIDKVKNEIVDGGYDDFVKKWVEKKAPVGFFKSTDKTEVSECYSRIVNWAARVEQFTDNAKAEFMSEKADAWLVSFALAYKSKADFCVCTFEQYHADVRIRIPIPNVCKAFDIECVNIYGLLRELKPKFILSSDS